MNAYQKTVQQLVAEFQTDPFQGLTQREAALRLQKYGFNKLPQAKHESIIWVFIRQFQSPLIYVLLIAASIIFFVGSKMDALIISAVLFFNAIVGTVQEGRTRTLLASLRKLIKVNAIVLRDGKHEVISDEYLVPGDVIILQEGIKIPADARVIEANSLQVDESILTGESEPVFKESETLPVGFEIADQKNMVFRGTNVRMGTGKAIVVATGQWTEVGRMQKETEELRTDIPLKKEVERLSHVIIFLVLGVCLFLLGLGLYWGKSLKELLISLTALFICVVPECLPVVVTLVLVTGAYRMARTKVLVKRLQGVDSLGRSEIIVIDKTGTLTRNEMMVCKIFIDDIMCTVTGAGYYPEGEIQGSVSTKTLHEAATACALLNRSEIYLDPDRNVFEVEGNPTEAALSVFAQKVGIRRDAAVSAYRQLYEIPFDRAYGYHTVFYEHNGRGIAYISGAPEVVGANAQALETMLSTGLRVVAIGKKDFELSKLPQGTAVEKEMHAMLKGMVPLALCGIQDAIRPEVPDVIRQTREAGLMVVMATGDHQKTALYVAKAVGIYRAGDECIDGSEFAELSSAELLRRLYKTTVYSRVTPEQKLKIVQLFHQQQKVVAVTGDGVNDAPALIAADVGIAMGGVGTEVAKEAADVILMNDSFTNIIKAIKQGRHISYALRRVILYFFATNFGEILVMLFALAINVPLPILAAQILWLNLITDGFLDVALSMEPQEKDLLNRKWLKKGMRLVDASLLWKMVYMAIPMGIGSLLVFLNYYQIDLAKARTMTLVTMAMFQWFNAWNCRSETKSLFQLGLFSNPWLIFATVFVAFLQVLVVRLPILQTIFNTVPLTMHELGFIVLITMPLLVMEECRKLFVRRFFFAR